MIRRHEEVEEEKLRQTEGMSAGDEYRMMLMMAEKHALKASQHREMVEEETQKGLKEAREKVVMEMEEMIEKGCGNVTFGSEKIRPGENIEREKGELERMRRKRVRRRRIEYRRGIWRRQSGMMKREEFREVVRAETRRKKGRVAKLLEV